MFIKAGDCPDLKMLPKVKIFLDKMQVGVFKFALFDGSESMTVGHKISCLEESITYTEGNCITIESVGNSVVNV